VCWEGNIRGKKKKKKQKRTWKKREEEEDDIEQEEQKYKNKNKSNIQMHKDTNENKNASMKPKWLVMTTLVKTQEPTLVTNTHPCNTGNNRLPMDGALVGVESCIILGIIAHEVYSLMSQDNPCNRLK
jgi:hypothetical protein